MTIETENGVEKNATIIFDLNIYNLDIIKKAAYRISNNGLCDFSLDNNKVTCNIYLSKNAHSITVDELAEQFRNEVLDQDLRQKISEETTHIRNVILAHTFSRTGLQEE